ncbi:MAG: glycosyltransferase family 4 protein [Phycisphaeraceae bacterium]
MKVLGKSIPGLGRCRLDFHQARYVWLMNRQLRRWFADVLAPRRFDVIHIISQEFAGALLSLRGPDKPALAVNVDACELQPTRAWRRRTLEHLFMARFERKLFDHCDLIVARNQWVADGLAAHYGLAERKIQLARNGIPLTEQHRLLYPPRAADEPVRLCFVGNGFARKGGPGLVRLHQARFADVAELHICSRDAPPDRSCRNVVWHGMVERERLLNALLPTMDIFVLPTRSDMAPLAVAEAASAALPVVATRVAGIPELVRHEETGLLCEPEDWRTFGDLVQRLIQDDALRRRMGEAGRKHIGTQYDPDAHFGGLIARLKSLGRAQASPTAAAAQR